MTAYQWLCQACSIEAELRQLRAMKQDYLDGVTTITPDMNGLPGSPSKDPHAMLDRYVQLTEKIDSSIRLLEKTKAEILSAIDELPDSRQRYILRAKYIPDSRGRTRSLKQISARMNYSYRQVLRLHNSALNEIERCHPMSH